LATKDGRYGYRRITTQLQWDGWRETINVWNTSGRREGLKVPQKQPKRGGLWLNDDSCMRLRPEFPRHVWGYDFVADRTHNGPPPRMLTVINESTPEWRSRWEGG
jgi:putative transposase